VTLPGVDATECAARPAAALLVKLLRQERGRSLLVRPAA
jgi:hypothetical protein